MAYYKDISDKRSSDDKRQDAEKRGGFADEGANYANNRPQGGARPAAGRPQSGGYGARPARTGNFGGNRPPHEGGNVGANRPPREGGNFSARPPREGGNFSARPPREGGNFGGTRPPREGGNFGGARPPREGGNFGGTRPTREGGNFSARPPREGGNFGGTRPPREGGNFGARPPREGGNFGARPPREGGNFGGTRPPREGGNFGARPPREGGNFSARPPREGGNFGSARPPREDHFESRPPRGDHRPDDRAPRSDADFRFSAGGQQPYRGRGSDVAPRSYDEQRRERRDGPAPRDYNSFRYETPERPPRPTYDAPEIDEEEIVPNENLLSGRNPIREALKAGRDIEKLLVARGDLSGSAREIIAMAKEQRVPVQEVDRARLDAITQNHQGMLAFASAYQYHTVEEMLALAEERGQVPFLVILDGITDPHNLGAIIRTAECAGAHGVVVQERRAVGLTPAAVKASAGAIEHIMVARVINIVATLEMLKVKNIWIYAADMAGEDYATVDFKGGAAIVIGAEGEGVSRLVLEKADKRVSLPIKGKLDSLNASVAAGILLYAVLRSR